MPTPLKQNTPFRSSLGLCLLSTSMIAGAYFVILSLFNTDAYKHVIREDGPVEYGSAILWLLAAFAVCSTLLFHKGKTRQFIAIYTGLLVFFICCCGEEISWGQRLLEFDGPELIVSINKQQETTLHNIGSISVFSNAFLCITVAVFIIYPYYATRRESWNRYVTSHHLPVVNFRSTVIFLVSAAVWIIVGIRFGTLGFHPFSLWGYYTQLDDEIFELFAAYCFFALALLDLVVKVRKDG